MSELFRDKVAMITGGGSGIGRALGKQLAERGAALVLADQNGEGAEQAAAEIRAGGGRARGTRLDVTDAAAVKAAVAEVAAEHGRLDYMFNNAGIGVVCRAHEMATADWRAVVGVNLMGVVHGVQAAYPLMVRQGFGHIVNTSSLAGVIPMPLMIAYTTSKFGVVGLSHALRIEARPLGVKVTVACPALTDTPILQSMKVVGFERDEVLAPTPNQKMSADECARIILRGVARNRAMIVISAPGKLMRRLYQLFPETLLAVMARMTNKTVTLNRGGGGGDSAP